MEWKAPSIFIKKSWQRYSWSGNPSTPLSLESSAARFVFVKLRQVPETPTHGRQSRRTGQAEQVPVRIAPREDDQKAAMVFGHISNYRADQVLAGF
jgi:hypothetical protein